jgi:hypothetical protein
LQKAQKRIEDSSKTMHQIHQEVTKYFAAVTTLKKSYAEMRNAVEEIAAGKPTWAQVGEVLISTAAAAGFMVAGNVNSPDPTKGLENINTIAGLVGNVQGSLDLSVNLSQGFEDSVAH